MSSAPTYYSNINTELLDLCPKADQVIEFGCGAGRFLEAYKQKFQDATCVGFEKFADAGKQAQDRCDKVVVADAEDTSILYDHFEKESFDLIIYGDVLEHFLDPWATLAHHASLLKPGGTICACIPNASHWSMVFNLVNGDFTYKDSGLLDRTHLRFFTFKTINDLFNENALKVEELRPRKFQTKGTEGAIQTISKLFGKPAGEISPNRLRDWSTFQYLVKATKS